MRAMAMVNAACVCVCGLVVSACRVEVLCGHGPCQRWLRDGYPFLVLVFRLSECYLWPRAWWGVYWLPRLRTG